ncbi:MAG TPA: hypothetical protein VLB00_08200 [Gemmatimonadales bacterium]|nr:hypothetical protein [Gemmatimonadales bacterium]
MRHLPALVAMALAACRADPPPPADPAPPPAPAAEPAWTVSWTGYGPIRVGWTVAELNAALNESVRPAYQASDECDYIHPARLPMRVNLMVVKDTVVRVDVDTTGVLTDKGAGVGDSEQRISELYGPVTVQLHKYRPGGRNLIVTDPVDSMFLREVCSSTDCTDYTDTTAYSSCFFSV